MIENRGCSMGRALAKLDVARRPVAAGQAVTDEEEHIA